MTMDDVIITPRNDALPGIGTKKIVQLNFVVRNLEKVKKSWGKILEGAMTTEYTIPPFEFAPTFTGGIREDCDDVRTLKFILDDGLVLAFWQPGAKDNPWKRQLEEYGDSLMNLEFSVPELEKAYEVICEATGVRGPYHCGEYPNMTYSFLDTRDSLLTELNICADKKTEG